MDIFDYVVTYKQIKGLKPVEGSRIIDFLVPIRADCTVCFRNIGYKITKES